MLRDKNAEVVLTNKNYKLYEKYDWYIPLCSKKINKILDG